MRIIDRNEKYLVLGGALDTGHLVDQKGYNTADISLRRVQKGLVTNVACEANVLDAVGGRGSDAETGGIVGRHGGGKLQVRGDGVEAAGGDVVNLVRRQGLEARRVAQVTARREAKRNRRDALV